MILESNYNNNISFLYYFILKRINRIFPALIITIFFTTIFGFILVGDGTLGEISKSGIKSLYAISDYYYYYSGKNYFSLLDQERFLLHTWTLSVELKFYVAFGILFLFVRNKSINFILISITLMLIVSIATSFFTFYFLDNNRAVFFLTPLRFYQFLFGSLAFLIHFKVSNKTKFSEWSSSICIISLILINFLIFIDFNNVILKNTLVAFTTFLILLFVFKIKIKNIYYKIISKISFLTYYIYLVHYPIIKFLTYYELKKNEIFLYTFILTALFTFLIKYVVKILSFKIVE